MRNKGDSALLILLVILIGLAIGHCISVKTERVQLEVVSE